MKKRRVLGIFLAAALVFSVMPAGTAEASPLTVSSYEEWLQYGQYGYDIDATYGFTWPEEGCTMVIKEDTTVTGEWVIPSNVTVINKARVTLDAQSTGVGTYASSSLTLCGTWENSGNLAGVLGGYMESYPSNIYVEDGGRFVIDEDTDHQQFTNMTVKDGGTLELNHYGSYVGAGTVLTLQSGADVTGNGGLRLDGTIHGEGAVMAAPISIQGGYMGGETRAVLSGDLTVGRINLIDSTLVIPAGSNVTCSGIQNGLYAGMEPAAIDIDGNLTVEQTVDARESEGHCTIDLGESGSFALREDAYFDTLSPDVTIKGNGTLKLYGRLSANGEFVEYAPSLVVDSQWGYIEENLASAIEKGYIADTVQIWRSWQCDHQWVKGAVTEPTCSSEGYTTYICSLCGEQKKEDYTDRLPHTSDGKTDCTQNSYCTVCGDLIRAAGEHDWKEVNGDSGELLAYRCGTCGAEQAFLLEAEPTVSLTLSEAAVGELAAQAEKEGYEEMTLRAETIGEDELTRGQSTALKALTDDALLLRLTLEAVSVDEGGNKEVTVLHELGGEAEVSVEYDAGELTENETVKTAYLAEDGSVEEIAAVYEEGAVTFTTTHFSDYAVYTAENEPEFTPGDVDDSGSVDIADLRLVLRAVCGKVTLTQTQKLAADVEKDGGVDIQDLRKILRYVCHKIDSFE